MSKLKFYVGKWDEKTLDPKQVKRSLENMTTWEKIKEFFKLAPVVWKHYRNKKY